MLPKVYGVSFTEDEPGLCEMCTNQHGFKCVFLCGVPFTHHGRQRNVPQRGEDEDTRQPHLVSGPNLGSRAR